MNNEIGLFLDSIKRGVKMLYGKYQGDLTLTQTSSLVILGLYAIETKNEFIELKNKGE